MDRPVEKTEYITSHCKGKSVLHVGCTCYPNTIVRIETDSFLHDRLLDVAERLHGIDVDEEGLEYMRKKGYRGICRVDARDLHKKNSELDDAYDVVLLGDMIEHVEDPGRVLKRASTRVKETGEMIVSVPNAFYWYGFINMLLFRREITHPDHVAWYSELNIRRLMNRLGFRIVEMRGFYEGPLTKKYGSLAIRIVKSLESKLLSLFPGVSCGIICRIKRQ